MSQVGKHWRMVCDLYADSVSEPGVPRHGWQCKAIRPVNERFHEGVVQPRLLHAALLRSQSGRQLALRQFPFCPSRAF